MALCTASHLPPILTVRSSATIQFLAAKSLCTNFLSDKYAIPSAISPAICHICFNAGGNRPSCK